MCASSIVKAPGAVARRSVARADATKPAAIHDCDQEFTHLAVAATIISGTPNAGVNIRQQPPLRLTFSRGETYYLAMRSARSARADSQPAATYRALLYAAASGACLDTMPANGGGSRLQQYSAKPEPLARRSSIRRPARTTVNAAPDAADGSP
jgi:hypothetical protein